MANTLGFMRFYGTTVDNHNIMHFGWSYGIIEYDFECVIEFAEFA